MMRRVYSVVLFFVFTLIATAPIFAQPSVEFDLCGKRPGEPPVDQTEYDNCYQCLYDSSGTPRGDFQWTVMGCLPTSAAGLTQVILDASTAVVGGIGFVIFLMGSFKILTSQGDADKLRTGKILISSSILAMLIVFFSSFIYRFVAENILKVPGVGG